MKKISFNSAMYYMFFCVGILNIVKTDFLTYCLVCVSLLCFIIETCAVMIESNLQSTNKFMDDLKKFFKRIGLYDEDEKIKDTKNKENNN